MMKIPYLKRIVTGLCVTTILLSVLSAAIYNSFRMMNVEKQGVDHTHAVMETLQGVLSNIKEIQSSQRGYVITGMAEYLSPYQFAVPRLNDGLAKLSELVADNPVQMGRAVKLEKHVRERIAVGEKVLALYRTEGQQPAMDMVKSGSGKREVDQISAIAADMIAEEQELLATRRTAVETYTRITLFASMAGLLVCIGILAAVFLSMLKETARREATEESLRSALDNMERITRETRMIAQMGDYLRSCRIPEEAYAMIASNFPAIFPQTYGCVALFNNSRNQVQTVLEWGALPMGAAGDFDPEACWALRQGRMHHIAADGAMPRCEHLATVKDDMVSLCFPMQAQGETIGQLFIGSPDAQRFDEDEIVTLRTVTEQVSLALANLSLQRALKEQSIRDPLTRLFNRRYLEETLSRECARARRNEQPLCVLMMDIDHFKKVNDTWGHDAGDAVLVAFARMLSGKVRKEDIACRLGGEEFVLVLPSATLELAAQRAGEICEATRELNVKYQSHIIPVTVSVGVARFPDEGQQPEDLLQSADIGLYRAKQNGRDQVVIHDGG